MGSHKGGGGTGVMAQMIAVLVLPLKEDCRMRVSLLSLYGMWPPALVTVRLSDNHNVRYSKRTDRYKVSAVGCG